MNICPVCSGPLQHESECEHDPHAGEVITALRADITRIEQNLEAMLTPLKQAEQAYAQATAGLVATATEEDILEPPLEAFGQTMAGDMEQRTQLRRQISS